MRAMMDAALTVFHSDTVGTGKTGETEFVGNQEFLRTVFCGELGRARPVVVSFRGRPQDCSQETLVRQTVAGQQ